MVPPRAAVTREYSPYPVFERAVDVDDAQQTGQIDGTVRIKSPHNERPVSRITRADVEQLPDHGQVNSPAAARFDQDVGTVMRASNDCFQAWQANVTSCSRRLKTVNLAISSAPVRV